MAERRERSMPDAMRAQDLKAELDWDAPKLGIGPWLNKHWRAEWKIDGCRAFLELGAKTNRFALTRSNVFPQFRDALLPSLAGTVLDGEFTAAVPRGGSVASNSSGLFNSGERLARERMRFNGRPTLWLFDVLSIGDRDVTGHPYDARREHLDLIVQMLTQMYPSAGFRLAPQLPATAHSIRTVLAKGGEGVILKRRASEYQRARRSGDWMKVKGISTAEGFVSGYREGEGYNTGKVGSLELSVHGNSGPRVVACINIPPALRAQCSSAGGALRPEFYGTVIEFTGHGIGAGGLVRIPIYVRQRPDKDAADCLDDQLDGWPDV